MHNRFYFFRFFNLVHNNTVTVPLFTKLMSSRILNKDNKIQLFIYQVLEVVEGESVPFSFFSHSIEEKGDFVAVELEQPSPPRPCRQAGCRPFGSTHFQARRRGSSPVPSLHSGLENHTLLDSGSPPRSCRASPHPCFYKNQAQITDS